MATADKPDEGPQKPQQDEPERHDTVTPPGRRTTAGAVTGALVDLAVVLAVAGLIYAQRITPTEGLPWLVLVLAGRLPPRKGGSASLTILSSLISIGRR